MIVYVSSPYSADTVEQIKTNVAFATEIGKRVLLAGHVPVIPHVMSAFWDYDGRFQHFSHEDWLIKYAMPVLEICDAVLMAGNWESSRGCLMELKHARDLYKAIYYGIERPKEKGGKN